MNVNAEGTRLVPAPADKAVVVFLRPEFKGYAISAAVYEDDAFLGIVMRATLDWCTRHRRECTARWSSVRRQIS